MAGHAWGGIELQQAIVEGRPGRFLLRLNAQDKWPFGFSLLLLPFLATSGDRLAAATLFWALLFPLIPLLLLWRPARWTRWASGAGSWPASSS
jgi:hypothetical protein